MFGGIGGRINLALVVALGFFIAAPASAADLGGDCCADLEERIAELEATTARKGNRKVSLEVSGQVNEAVLWWDDGAESNAYVVTNDNSRTRFRFKGKAKIDKEWEAGYQIEVGVRSANSKRFTQSDTDEGCRSRHGFRSARFLLVPEEQDLRARARWVCRLRPLIRSPRSILRRPRTFSKYSDVEDTGLGLFVRSANDRTA